MVIKSRTGYRTTIWSSGYTVVEPTVYEWIDTTYSPRNKRGRYTRFNPVTHIKCVDNNAWDFGPGAATVSESGRVEWIQSIMSNLIAGSLSQAYIALDFQKNDDFGLLVFLAELDETIALFAKDLWELALKGFRDKSTYGAIQWGVIPFVDELFALIDSFKDTYDGIVRSMEKLTGHRISRRSPVKGTIIGVDGKVRFEYEGFVAFHGFLNFPVPSGADAISIFLDELGFHPDLKTIWDLIPASFVVDYFVPISDMIESIHPRGWFNPTMSFLQTRDFYWSLNVEIKAYGNRADHVGHMNTHNLYLRSNEPVQVSSRPPVIPDWDVPSLKNLLDTLYVVSSRI